MKNSNLVSFCDAYPWIRGASEGKNEVRFVLWTISQNGTWHDMSLGSERFWGVTLFWAKPIQIYKYISATSWEFVFKEGRVSRGKHLFGRKCSWPPISTSILTSSNREWEGRWTRLVDTFVFNFCSWWKGAVSAQGTNSVSLSFNDGIKRVFGFFTARQTEVNLNLLGRWKANSHAIITYVFYSHSQEWLQVYWLVLHFFLPQEIMKTVL